MTDAERRIISDGARCRVGIDICDWLPVKPSAVKMSYCHLYRKRLRVDTRGALCCQECLDRQTGATA